MSEEQARKIIAEEFDKHIMSDLDSAIIFKYIRGLEQENQQLKEQVQDLKADYGTIAQIERDLYKEVINEAREVAQELKLHYQQHPTMIPSVKLNNLLQILDKAKENK